MLSQAGSGGELTGGKARSDICGGHAGGVIWRGIGGGFAFRRTFAGGEGQTGLKPGRTRPALGNPSFGWGAVST